MTRPLITVAVLLAFSASAHAALTIDTEPGFGFAGQFGEEGWGTTKGQTFTASTGDSRIVDYQFRMGNQNTAVSRDDIHFSLYLAKWDDTNHHAVGPVLYKSPETTYVGTVGFFVTQSFHFDIGVNLTPGEKYVAFVSTIEYLDGPPYVPNTVPASYEGLIRISADTSYAGGGFVAFNLFNSAVPTFNQLFTGSWDTFGFDTAFVANFAPPVAIDPPATATPEPTTLAIWGIGVLGCAAAGYRRRREKSKSSI